MKLIYKIEFNTTNLYFKNIIEDLISDARVNATCKQYEGFILIEFFALFRAYFLR